MKKIRFISLVMVLVLVVAAFAACQPVVDPDNGEEIDDTKTQLYVYVAQWGFGTEWFKQSKKEYEDLNKDRVFEEGKKGIQIIPQYRKSNLSVSEIRGDRINEVFFLEGVPYYSYYTEKLFTDITSYVTGENPYEKGVSIESKMTAQQKDGLKIDGKYYAVPGYSGSYGLIYNAELFDQYQWYFNAAGEMICEQRVKDKVKGAGPNGIAGDYDDGLPQTYEQFFKLCDKIAAYQDYTPVSWPGSYAAQHLEGLLETLVANYEGAENISRRINFSGSEQLVAVDANGKISIDGNGKVVLDPEATTIGNNNGYDVFRQAGIYYGLSFIEKLIKTSKYHNETTAFGTYSHYDAQDDFIYAGKDGKGRMIPAMIVDGDWWQSEASATFEDTKQYGTKYERDFRYMPLPKATVEQIGKNACDIDYDFSYSFVSANTEKDKVAIAADFIQFVHTNEQMVKFTKITNTIKALDYTMTDDDFEELTPYGKSLFKYKKSGKSDTIILTGSNAKFLSYLSRIQKPCLASYTVNGKTLNYTPVQAFREIPDNANAKNYFENMFSEWKSIWK